MVSWFQAFEMMQLLTSLNERPSLVPRFLYLDKDQLRVCQDITAHGLAPFHTITAFSILIVASMLIQRDERVGDLVMCSM